MCYLLFAIVVNTTVYVACLRLVKDPKASWQHWPSALCKDMLLNLELDLDSSVAFSYCVEPGAVGFALPHLVYGTVTSCC